MRNKRRVLGLHHISAKSVLANKAGFAGGVAMEVERNSKKNALKEQMRKQMSFLTFQR